MVEYKRFEDALTSSDFQDYAMLETGKKWGDIDKTEQMDMFVKFMSKQLNINPQDLSLMSYNTLGKTNSYETDDVSLKLVAQHYFPDKKSFSEMSASEKAFVVVSAEAIKRNDIELGNILDYLKSQEQNHTADTEKSDIDNADNKKNDAIKKDEGELVVDTDDKKKNNDKDKSSDKGKGDGKGEGNGDGGNQDKEDIVKVGEARIRSANSDKNELMIDLIRIEALNGIGEVKDEDIYQQDANGQFMLDAQGHRIMKDMTIKEVSDILSEKLLNLSKEKMVQYEDELAGLLLRSEYVDKIPPSLLAQQYTRLEARIAEEQNATRKSDMQNQMRYYGTQMDKVIASAARGLSNGQDLHFADITNIADIHKGYKEIFALRSKHYDELIANGTDQEKQFANAQKQAIAKVEPRIDEEYNNYLSEMDLDSLSRGDDGKLVQRYDEYQKIYSTMELDEQTLKLVSGFKFLDEQGNPEPQFIDANGNKSDTYTQGAKIIEGSKLAQQIQMAQEIVMIQSLGSNADIKADDVKTAVQAQLPKNLFALHVATQEEKGVAENTDQFTNARYLAEFTRNLTNPEIQYTVTPSAYECGTDGMVNYVGGYQAALADKVGPESQIVDKLTQPIAHMDQRADSRSNASSNMSKREVRIEMLKRCAKGFTSAFIVSGGITAVSTMAAAQIADASITGATLGTNKAAGLIAMGIGTVVGVGLTLRQINKWRKARKAEGKSAGFKDFIKDRKMVMTTATTILGCAALGAAATGNPGWAAGLGTAALTIGTANGVISNYQDSKRMGLSKLESIGWSVAQAGANIIGMQAGIQTAHAGIDWYNKHNPDNTLFQHRETHTETTSETIKTEEIVYKDGAIEASKETLMKLYDGNTEALNHDLSQVKAQLEAMGVTDVDPHRALQMLADAGMNTGVDKINFNGTDYVHNNGNNCVMGEGWQQTQGISSETVNALASVKGPDGTITITPETVQALRTVDPLVSMSNQVGYGGPTSDHFVDTRPGGLDNNAVRQDGVFVGKENGDFFATNANGESAFETRINETTVTHTNTTETLVPNEVVRGWGMFGVMGNILKPIKKLKDRVGSLLDATKSIFKKKDNPTPIVIIKKKKKPYEKPIITVTEIVKPDPSIKLLMDEYEIVYGIKPKEDGQSFKNYCKRVEKEHQSDASEQNMVQFLLNRRSKLDEAINKGAPEHEKKEHNKMATIGRRAFSPQVITIRENIMTSNLTAQNYQGAITMSAFITMAPYALDRVGEDGRNAHLIGKEGSRDISKNPNLDRYDETSTFTVTDLNKLLVEKLPLAKCQISGTGIHAMKEAMYQVRKDNGGQGAPEPKEKADRVNPRANPKQKNNGNWKTGVERS